MSRVLQFPSSEQAAAEIPKAAVLIAPWDGPNGEIVLIARDSRRRLLGEPMVVPHGADHVAASDELWKRVPRSERGLELVR